MISIETIRIKLRRAYMHRTAKWRRKQIHNDDWTIISNNCWGGFVSQSYGVPYNSPTVGSFFMAEDYIEFISDLKAWMGVPLSFIQPESSKYKEHFSDWDKFGTYAIGVLKLDNKIVEIHFLHYHSEQEAMMHWNERKKRINWNKILYKFNDQNLCTEKHLKCFAEMPLEHKICFTSKKYDLADTYFIKCPKHASEIRASYEPFGKSRYVDINALINSL